MERKKKFPLKKRTWNVFNDFKVDASAIRAAKDSNKIYQEPSPKRLKDNSNSIMNSPPKVRANSKSKTSP